MMDYAVHNLEHQAVHASDLFPTFWNANIDMARVLRDCKNVLEPLATKIAEYLKSFAPAYQSYFTSHAIDGNPNSHTHGWANSSKWQNASSKGDKVTNVLRATGNSKTPFITDYEDVVNTQSACAFWNQIAAEIQGKSGKGAGDALVVQGAYAVGPEEL
ncbi:hypothetical protein MMC28_004049 [Mycoblastus sanguinarius]|nr:hypothetical protein [Mycoblastus sanguinarius]